MPHEVQIRPYYPRPIERGTWVDVDRLFGSSHYATYTPTEAVWDAAHTEKLVVAQQPMRAQQYLPKKVGVYMPDPALLRKQRKQARRERAAIRDTRIAMYYEQMHKQDVAL